MTGRVRPAVAALVLGATTIAGCGNGRDTSTVMPHIELTSVVAEGSSASSTVMADEVHGPALINLWATWCGPCRTEMPAFQSVADESPPGVAIMGVNEGDDATAASAFLQDVGVRFGQFLDPDGALIDKLRIAGLPATIVLNADGDIVSVHSGALDEAGIRALIATAGP